MTAKYRLSGSLVRCLTLLAITFTATGFLNGCSREQEPAFVDFSKTRADSHPPQEIADGSVIRVAVAAMISAKESVVYYHQLLDFIGNQLGHKIKLVQRKTYSEINDLLKTGKSIWPSSAPAPMPPDGKLSASKPWRSPRSGAGIPIIPT